MKLLIALILALFGLTAMAVPNHTYTKKTNHVQYPTGMTFDKDWKKRVTFVDPFAIAKLTFPDAVDLRKKAANGYPTVKNQGQCGSCWVFGSVAALEGTEAVEKGKVYDLSEQQALACSGAGSCNGGYFDVLTYMVNPGLTDEAHYPYEAQDTRCPSGLPVVAQAKQWLFVGGSDQVAPTDDQLRYVLQYKPLVVTVYADNNFMDYNGGVFDEGQGGTTNHMVSLVGYYSDAKGVIYILKNSWGSNWGENGYMRIRSNSNNLAQAAAFVRLQ